MLWKRLQPTENMRGSLFFKIFLCHLCFLIRTCAGAGGLRTIHDLKNSGLGFGAARAV